LGLLENNKNSRLEELTPVLGYIGKLGSLRKSSTGKASILKED
jgi:hypothetical protein